ncbi:hypothetical protein [Lelliottia sp. CFBP8978]|jgi:hypothetical protein|uniref:hypothetical protein n=1 Tax=Lelliottia sp. CFBP8978 TaxID=3096522 RepID=UPI002A69D350|nr:hypothetical protein [Lelliottia sp. CFBP8978]MDY1035713.1 hypothetical protein [Lelliottia sp. CFBP8978]
MAYKYGMNKREYAVTLTRTIVNHMKAVNDAGEDVKIALSIVIANLINNPDSNIEMALRVQEIAKEYNVPVQRLDSVVTSCLLVWELTVAAVVPVEK